VSLSFKLKQKHSKCRITAEGTLGETSAQLRGPGEEPEPEITGTYTASPKKRDGATGGTFDLVFQPTE